MSLEIIEYNKSMGRDEFIALIKQRTGLELEQLDGNTNGIATFNMRFPDMETAQSIKFAYPNSDGTLFIDADNHFLCYSIASGTGDYDYVDNLYKALVVDFNGKLANVCFTENNMWYETINASTISKYLFGNALTQSNITLCPLRVFAQKSDGHNVKGFVKNCYMNYDRRFQKGLKFIDQNGNRFMTLGGYLLYKID